ncbi:MAG: sigma-70 family RNA polymerase sigma factor [Verrucomicrobium sp.]|nr:sigma-70 family RNA polymerase sigma factor [Verrucomicrobium sp.]
MRSDHQLMEAVAQGDEAAFRELVERHQRPVYGTILKMLGDPHEAEDLAQRVFLRVYQAAPRYRPDAQFSTWLYTILRRLVFNESERRNRSRHRFLSQTQLAGEEGEIWDSPDTRQQDPAAALADRERQERVDAAVRDLPENQRLAVLLQTHQDLSYEEIASILKTSVSATKSILFRARETLRKSLQKEL